MPHKHKRRQNDESTFNLPPTRIAKSLPTRDPSKPAKGQHTNTKGKGKSKGQGKDPRKWNPKAEAPKPQPTAAVAKKNEAATSRKKTATENDTPREFRHLMRMHEARVQAQLNKKRKVDEESGSGSESDGSDSESDGPAIPQNKNKKNAAKTKQAANTAASADQPSTEEKAASAGLKILPGEKLGDFAARVDREMPLSQMKRTSNPTGAKDLPKLQDHKVTKHEKHLKRLQKQWREDEARIKDREAAEQEEREEENEEQTAQWKAWDDEAGKTKKRNPNHSQSQGSKKRKGADDDDGPDPWAKLKKKRAAVNPFDVAQEPPQLKKPREIFKVRGGAKVDVANVPSAVGSLRRREELANERRSIVDEYRRLMAEKRGA